MPLHCKVDLVQVKTRSLCMIAQLYRRVYKDAEKNIAVMVYFLY